MFIDRFRIRINLKHKWDGCIIGYSEAPFTWRSCCCSQNHLAKPTNRQCNKWRNSWHHCENAQEKVLFLQRENFKRARRRIILPLRLQVRFCEKPEGTGWSFGHERRYDKIFVQELAGRVPRPVPRRNRQACKGSKPSLVRSGGFATENLPVTVIS